MKNNDHHIKRLNSLMWFGGKSFLLDKIYPFPKHTKFIDLFGGGCTVLLNKPRSMIECYNDINDRLINFFRVLQNQWMELEFLIKYRCPFKSRELFEKYKEKSVDSLEDAMQFFYVNHMSFSGNGFDFSGIHTSESRNFQFIMENKIKQFPEIAKRLKGVIIENQDFRKIIDRFDSEDALFYIDPPYLVGGENYQKMIGNEEHEWIEQDCIDLWDMLTTIQGKYVVSYDQIPKQLSNQYIQKVQRYNNSANLNTNKSVSIEYIIRNFTNNFIQREKLEKNGNLIDFGFTFKKLDGEK